MYHDGHSLWGLINPKEYFASHPEYFALVNGERQSGYAQPCTSNPEVIDIVANSLVNQTYNRPPGGWRLYPVGQNDSGLYCECQKCKAMAGDKQFTYGYFVGNRVIGTGEGTFGNTANGYLKFVNAVAERVEKSLPNCRLNYYALYNQPGWPEVEPRHNVVPVMCHFFDNEEHRSQILKWEAISESLYYYGYVGYRLSMPKFGIVEDIRWCKEHKGIAMTVAEDEHSPVNMVTCYLIAKAAWDVDTDAEEVLAEFYTNYFAEAAEPMKAFYETFDAATREATKEWDIHAYYPDSLTPAIMTRCRGYIGRARAMAKQAVVRRRIEDVSAYWRAVELHIRGREIMKRWRKNKTAALERQVRAAAKELIDYLRSPEITAKQYLLQRVNLAERWLKELDGG